MREFDDRQATVDNADGDVALNEFRWLFSSDRQPRTCNFADFAKIVYKLCFARIRSLLFVLSDRQLTDDDEKRTR